jgi:hypothetical protein
MMTLRAIAAHPDLEFAARPATSLEYDADRRASAQRGVPSGRLGLISQ